MSPQVCDHRVVPHRWVVREWWAPWRSAVDAGFDAAARAQRAARAVDGDVADVPQALHLMRSELLHLTPSATTIACYQINYVDTYEVVASFTNWPNIL